jgi:signal peptidase II
MKPLQKWMVLGLVTILGLSLDLFTKFLAVSNLSFADPVPVIGKFVQLFLVYNRGALFGINPTHMIPGFPVNMFFFIFSIIAVALLFWYFHGQKTPRTLPVWGIALVLPGALGNLYDRLLYPSRGVVDFIRLGISETVYWPIFNFADVYITVGVLLLIFDMLLNDKAAKRQTMAKS